MGSIFSKEAPPPRPKQEFITAFNDYIKAKVEDKEVLKQCYLLDEIVQIQSLYNKFIESPSVDAKMKMQAKELEVFLGIYDPATETYLFDDDRIKAFFEAIKGKDTEYGHRYSPKKGKSMRERMVSIQHTEASFASATGKVTRGVMASGAGKKVMKAAKPPPNPYHYDNAWKLTEDYLVEELRPHLKEFIDEKGFLKGTDASHATDTDLKQFLKTVMYLPPPPDLVDLIKKFHEQATEGEDCGTSEGEAFCIKTAAKLLYNIVRDYFAHSADYASIKDELKREVFGGKGVKGKLGLMQFYGGDYDRLESLRVNLKGVYKGKTMLTTEDAYRVIDRAIQRLLFALKDPLSTYLDEEKIEDLDQDLMDYLEAHGIKVGSAAAKFGYYDELNEIYDSFRYENGIHSGQYPFHHHYRPLIRDDYTDIDAWGPGSPSPLLIGGVVGASAIVVIMLIFCLGLACGVIIYWGYAQKKALDVKKFKKKEEIRLMDHDEEVSF